MMRAVLAGASDIPEDCLVRCISLVLARASKESLDAFVTACAVEEPERPVLDHDQVRRNLLNLILTRQREQRLLVAALRAMPLKHTARLLKYLQNLLHMHALHAFGKRSRPRGSEVPDMNCVIEWTCAVLDAHYTSLVLAPDCRKVLEDIRAVIKKEAVLVRSILSLDGPLSHVVNRKKLPVKPRKDYQQDTLFL